MLDHVKKYQLDKKMQGKGINTSGHRHHRHSDGAGRKILENGISFFQRAEAVLEPPVAKTNRVLEVYIDFYCCGRKDIVPISVQMVPFRYMECNTCFTKVIAPWN